MELSIQLIEQAAEMLRGHSQDTREKRVQPRVGLRARAKIRPLLNDVLGKQLDVWVRDLSVGGIGMSCQFSLPSGTAFVLTVPNRGGDPVDIQYRVAHCRQMGMSVIYSIGGQFDRILTPLALKPDSPLAAFARRKAS